ncbi:HAMP domain-containing histidine kinase [Mesorhizobium sp. RP14(2022)]|uniref:histidine kinase n=1 Tax=Mesorhizobium liriopis TaxID=2953882 RepID=A0ABT1C3R3_9HYPH|nr:HAMP domain-containing sensor histidine kinase [Mesorhizobium liriopis]MCO6048621.1 HAMP domain-containing histidine kinase [Mesorhizobium liriopis]
MATASRAAAVGAGLAVLNGGVAAAFGSVSLFALSAGSALACGMAAWAGWQSSNERVASTADDNRADERGVLRLRFDATGEADDVAGDARALVGLAPELLLGAGFFDRLQVSDRVSFLCALSEIRADGQARTLSLRVRLPRVAHEQASGYRRFTVELQRLGSEGRSVEMALRDTSEIDSLRAELDEARKATADACAERQRIMAALGHEIRTPLNAIIGFSDMLGEESLGGFSDPRQQEYSRLIRQSGEHLLLVLDGVLQASAMEAGAYRAESESFSITDAVETCRAMLADTARLKGVTLKVQIASSCGTVSGDRRSVQQILVNLVSNAIKFTPSGGEVAVGGQRVGSRLHLWVRDNGVGIDAGDLDRVGQPFVRVGRASAVEGHGLGLSLVKTLVQNQGGTFSIESAPGEGTLATVSLPVDQPSIRRPETTSAETKNDATFRKSA